MTDEMMLVKKSSLTAIADKIRGKTGSEDLIPFEELVSAIEGISGGGDIAALVDRSITEYSNNTISTIGGAAFANCRYLVNLHMPSVIQIGNFAFQSCLALTELSFPALTTLNTFAFQGCSALYELDLGICTNIPASSFQSCSALKSLILRKTDAVCTLTATSAFTNTLIASGTGYIYVPSALIEDYKAATNWSTYADQFRALEDYTVDGTTTGELDETKIGETTE